MSIYSKLKEQAKSTAPRGIIRLAKAVRGRYLSVRDRDTVLRRIMAADRASVEAAHLGDVEKTGMTVIASTGMSNIGDQAMLDSIMANTPGSIEVGVKAESTYRIPAGVKTFDATSLIYGSGSARRKALGVWVESLRKTGRLGIVGADIIDGGYQRGVAVKSWSLAAAAAHAGIDTRIFGFSWGENIDPLVIDAARAALEAGVRVIVRDSVSARRFAKDTGLEPIFGADMVFSLDWESEPEPPVAVTSPYVLVNVSGLIASRMDISDDMLRVCSECAQRGRTVVLVPHVANVGGDDIAAINAFTEKLDEANIDYIALDTLYSPAQIAMLAREADCVVTGRMHLAILAMNQLTPAVVLATHGKVEGLLTDVGLPSYAVNPEPGCGEALEVGIADAMDHTEERTAQLRKGVGLLRQRSQENFVGVC
ncbi:hypothetical protein GSS87_08735 [Corynebacterium sp. 4HC-13]|uniref:polysaccharide pyruvyl transferase family protein n=1 Tax=Corynebacterium anserum TaxID=2684406 RepID=UPI001639646D|nr:polysaccharide pyruvyl transferase family protein [Corynebacterium anserum]MBC2682471.1 hypothetical protein [Corynebacterium anserum]